MMRGKLMARARLGLAVGFSILSLGGAQAAPAWQPIAAENLLVIDSTKGRIIVELRPDMAPAHVARVRKLTREGFYDGLHFHRVIDGFMAQTGDPTNQDDGRSAYPDLKAEFTFRRSADQPLVIAAQPTGAVLGLMGSVPVQTQPNRVMAWTGDHKASAWGLYCPGVVGAGRNDKENSANSEFFLMRQAYPALDKRYTVWGRVVVGLSVVRALKTGEPVQDPDRMETVRLMADLPKAQQRRISLPTPDSPIWTRLISKARLAKGADFSVCDITVPVRVSP
jgi:peptidylprolyl isomerase